MKFGRGNITLSEEINLRNMASMRDSLYLSTEIRWQNMVFVKGK